jgi:ethylbenzene dehydrogenase
LSNPSRVCRSLFHRHDLFLNFKVSFMKQWKSVIVLFTIVMMSACGKSSSDVAQCLDNGSCVATLDVLKISGDLPRRPDAAFWSSANAPKKISLELGPQMFTNPKWPDPSVKEVNLSAVRNGSDIVFLLEWEDATKDNFYGHSDRYTDQAAIMFPLQPAEEAPMITMGSENEVVNIWQWKAAWEKDSDDDKNKRARRQEEYSTTGTAVAIPDRASPVEDLNAEGFSTLTIQDEQNVQGKGVWKDKRWRVVFRRSLIDSDSGDAQFKGDTQMAVAVWNGGNNERNGQKGIIGWVLLRLH